MNKAKKNIVCQFRVELTEIEPLIWRRIQVPATYSFWDLHVAIQDSMGWLDYHLHVFRLRLPRRKKVMGIGIPDDEGVGEVTLPGWEIPITEYFTEPGKSALYEYDFGDGWGHRVLLEGILLKETGVRYPKCIAGERACPPIIDFWRQSETPTILNIKRPLLGSKGTQRTTIRMTRMDLTLSKLTSGTQRSDGEWRFLKLVADENLTLGWTRMRGKSDRAPVGPGIFAGRGGGHSKISLTCGILISYTTLYGNRPNFTGMYRLRLG